ncbi:M15 family metallopeptidase [Serratia fonticola]|uniref:M15 family metallopeptidase n=1 Tax=Serratia fonticola TaxID=47917 RepID=UPI0015C6801C|nr:M15 family metallopeptidase [Serratia fonticola]NYA15743.1 M15 family metallopeptidase [Serratia fonticola]NYA35863.1 M15 family metallopeptidase [Serratia fonticola]
MLNFKFSARSEANLKGVDPALVKVIRRALELSSVDFGVREGVRTLEQQRQYVKQGVSQTMKSRHLTGHAVDLYPSKLPVDWGRRPEVFIPMLQAVKQAGDELGVNLRFGINWKNDPALPIETRFPDAPHVELPA